MYVSRKNSKYVMVCLVGWEDDSGVGEGGGVGGESTKDVWPSHLKRTINNDKVNILKGLSSEF
jgi:hypothetical protein